MKKSIILMGITALIMMFIAACDNPFLKDKAGLRPEAPESITKVSVAVTSPVKSMAPDTSASGGKGYSCGPVLWEPVPGYSQFQGGTKYTAAVKLTANKNYIFATGFTAVINGFAADVLSNTGEEAKISLEFDATLDKIVTSISIKTQPTEMTYTHGDTLDLDGLVVTLAFDDGTSEDFELANFGTTISTSLANGEVLSRTGHDGQPVIVYFGDESVGTENLVVNKADPTVIWPTGLTAFYGQTLSNISLSSYTNSGGTAGSFTWATPSASVNALGTRSHSITFTPTETVNYNILTQNVNIYVSLVEMVSISGGTFTMGSPVTEVGREITYETQHQVTLNDFYIGKYEITQAQWQTVMGSLPRDLPSRGYGVGDNYPVYYVNWFNALVFCNMLSIYEGLSPAYRINNSTDPSEWGEVPYSTSQASHAIWNAAEIVSGSTGYRLPTEAQWEYACRAGTTSPFNTGNNITTDQANYDGRYPYNGNPVGINRQSTTPVGTFAANAWGLYDMHGNVAEWCWDLHWSGSSYYNNPAAAGPDPAGPDKPDPTLSINSICRIRRNGMHSSGGDSIRSAYRIGDLPDHWGTYYFNCFGFRLARPDN